MPASSAQLQFQLSANVEPGYDHVIVEAWLNGRWVRFDPEVEAPRPSLSTPQVTGLT